MGDELPSGLLPICGWGCAIFSLVECHPEPGRMRGYDPNPGPIGSETFRDEFTLAEWLARWIGGRPILQPTLIEDATTSEWRGATQAS